MPGSKVESLLWLELARRAHLRMPHRLTAGGGMMPWLHDAFDRCASRRMSKNSDLFVGWSGQSERVLINAKSVGQIAVLERGSTHIVHQRDVLLEEYRRLGTEPQVPHPSVVAKELREYEIADYICVPSRFARETFVRHGIPETKLIGTAYGVEIDDFPRAAQTSSVFRLIYVGGMTIRKGVHYLLAAWAKLRLPNAELWLVGTRGREIGPFFERHQGIFRHFGHVPQIRLRHFYSQCSAFAICSLEDGLSMVTVQAMSSALPVICTPNTGAADIVNEGVEGFIVPVRDVDAIADRILFLYTHRPECRLMGARARLTVEQGFTWTDYGNRMHDVYRTILAQRLN